jgi:hypothetical protein
LSASLSSDGRGCVRRRDESSRIIEMMSSDDLLDSVTYFWPVT